ncbi:MAG: hypothetical protein ACYTBJ_17545 [Planctomycetota bacterium]|jgi:hypothetical protein
MKRRSFIKSLSVVPLLGILGDGDEEADEPIDEKVYCAKETQRYSSRKFGLKIKDPDKYYVHVNSSDESMGRRHYEGLGYSVEMEPIYGIEMRGHTLMSIPKDKIG